MTECWCCGSVLTTSGECPICDAAVLMSPPHLCARSGRFISDEHNCDLELAPATDFTPLAPDHETFMRRK